MGPWVRRTHSGCSDEQSDGCRSLPAPTRASFMAINPRCVASLMPLLVPLTRTGHDRKVVKVMSLCHIWKMLSALVGGRYDLIPQFVLFFGS